MKKEKIDEIEFINDRLSHTFELCEAHGLDEDYVAYLMFSICGAFLGDIHGIKKLKQIFSDIVAKVVEERGAENESKKISKKRHTPRNKTSTSKTRKRVNKKA